MATYAVDVHGTLAGRGPDGSVVPSPVFTLLRGLMQAWMQQGEKVYILSGPSTAIIRRELDRLGLGAGVHFDGVLSVVDFLKDEGVEMWEDPVGSGRWWAEDGEWNSAKSRIVARYGITVVVDDTAAYGETMPARTSFVLLGTGESACR